MLPSLLVGRALVLLTGEGVERSLVSLAGMGLSARRMTREVEKARVLLLLRMQRLVRRAGSIVCGLCEVLSLAGGRWRGGRLSVGGAVRAPRLDVICASSVSALALSAVFEAFGQHRSLFALRQQ